MNHKEKQKEILKDKKQSEDAYGFDLMYDVEKAKAHKEEVMKGCMKETKDSVKNTITVCKEQPKGVFIEHAENLTKDGFKAIRKVVNSPEYKFKLCPTCKAIIDKYSEEGI